MKIFEKTSLVNKKTIFVIKLLKSKIYSINKNFLMLTKILNIIYKFHTNNKKILFLGINTKFNGLLKLIKKKTKHIFIPNNLWLNGLITNMFILKYLCIKDLFYRFLFNIKSKTNFDLIVIFPRFEIKNELIKSNILTLIFNNRKFYFYNLNINPNDQHLFLLLIYKLLKI